MGRAVEDLPACAGRKHQIGTRASGIIIPESSASIRPTENQGAAYILVFAEEEECKDVDQHFSLTGPISVTNGHDGNATFTLSATPAPGSPKLPKNGVVQTPSVPYLLSGIQTPLLLDIPVCSHTLLAWGAAS